MMDEFLREKRADLRAIGTVIELAESNSLNDVETMIYGEERSKGMALVRKIYEDTKKQVFGRDSLANKFIEKLDYERGVISDQLQAVELRSLSGIC